ILRQRARTITPCRSMSSRNASGSFSTTNRSTRSRSFIRRPTPRFLKARNSPAKGVKLLATYFSSTLHLWTRIVGDTDMVSPRARGGKGRGRVVGQTRSRPGGRGADDVRGRG